MVKRLGYSSPYYRNPMVTADKNAFVTHSASELLTYFVVGALVTVVVRDTVVESNDVLVGHV